jgi:hypothetical protein
MSYGFFYTYIHILSKNLKQEIESKGRFAVWKFRFTVCSESFGKQPGAPLLPEKTPTHQTFQNKKELKFVPEK